MATTPNRKRKTFLASILIIVIGCALPGAAWLTAGDDKDANAPPAPKWQHLALTHDDPDRVSGDELAARMNALGRDGWELVSVEGYVRGGTTTKTIFFFKKRL